MAHNIYLFSIFGNLDRPAAGGGEAASRRLWHTMEDAGFNVTIFNRHRYDWFAGFGARILLCFWFVFDPTYLFFKLLFLKRKGSAFIFRSYSGALLLFDLATAVAGRLAGHTTVMCLAGGRALPDYKKGLWIYKLIFKLTLLCCHEVMCEGEVSCSLVKEATRDRVRTFYLPNFTERGYAPSQLPDKPKDIINIIYFGRICKKKEVLLGIEIFNRLCERYDTLHYTIIGSGDPVYCDLVENAINDSPYKDRIERHPISTSEFIIEKLKQQHIFLFPSNEHCEGHSNALNEAMSWGVVPVVSDINYLPQIVGNSQLIVHGYAPEDYTKAISSLIDNDSLSELSLFVFKRIQDNFTQDIVQDRLKAELLSICRG